VDRRFGGSVVRWFVGSLVPLKSSGNFGYFVCQLLGVPAPAFLAFYQTPPKPQNCENAAVFNLPQTNEQTGALPVKLQNPQSLPLVGGINS